MKKVWALIVLFLANQLALGATTQFKYDCQVWSSDFSTEIAAAMDQSKLTVDSDGSFVLYEDAHNNCNGNRDTKSPGYLYRTDCEWEGFLDVVIDRNMVDGAELGMARLKTENAVKHRALLFCARQSSN